MKNEVKTEPGLGAIPEHGTQYWYIRGCMQTHSFKVQETQWIGGMSDILRLAKGNVYLYPKSANAVCMMLNERVEILTEQCMESKTHPDVIPEKKGYASSTERAEAYERTKAKML